MRPYFKFLLALYFTALAACLSCRVYLKLFQMDTATGFYIDGGIYETVFNILLAAVPVIAFLTSRLLRPDEDYPVEMRDRLLRALCAAAGLALAVFVFFGPPESNLRQAHGPAFYQLANYLRWGFGGLAALAFVFLGAAGVFGRKKTTVALLLLMPPLWQIIYLVTRYNFYTTVASISDHLLMVLFMVFNAVFLMGFARTISLQMRNDGRNYAIPAGLCASLCGFLLTLPNYIYMAVNRTAMPVALLGISESIYIFVMSVLALAFTLALMGSLKRV